MSYRRPRGPIDRVKGLSRVEGADVVSRVRAAERVSGVTALDPDSPSRRSFAAALERCEQGLHRSEPLPGPPVRTRTPLPAPRREPEDDERPYTPEPLPDTFLGLLWWKVKTRL